MLIISSVLFVILSGGLFSLLDFGHLHQTLKFRTWCNESFSFDLLIKSEVQQPLFSHLTPFFSPCLSFIEPLILTGSTDILMT